MFQQGVLIWGQRCAYMDEIVCHFHSELIREELDAAKLPGAVHVVDLFAGELTENVAVKNYADQIGHCLLSINE